SETSYGPAARCEEEEAAAEVDAPPGSFPAAPPAAASVPLAVHHRPATSRSESASRSRKVDRYSRRTAQPRGPRRASGPAAPPPASSSCGTVGGRTGSPLIAAIRID